MSRRGFVGRLLGALALLQVGASEPAKANVGIGYQTTTDVLTEAAAWIHRWDRVAVDRFCHARHPTQDRPLFHGVALSSAGPGDRLLVRKQGPLA